MTVFSFIGKYELCCKNVLIMIPRKLPSHKVFKPGRRRYLHQQDETVECGVCGESMRYDSLKKHFKRKHQDKDICLKNEGSATKIQKKIGSFFTQISDNG